MEQCYLTDQQKVLIRLLISGLKAGTVNTEWVVRYNNDGLGISLISNMTSDDPNRLWTDGWQNVVKPSDMDNFVNYGLFSVIDKNEYGLPRTYRLHKQRIIKAEKTNFGEPLR